jgi:hypothetical protein
MAYPRVAILNDALHVFALGHWGGVGPTYIVMGPGRSRGICHYVRTEGGWDRLTSVTEAVESYDWRLSRNKNGVLMAAQVRRDASGTKFGSFAGDSLGNIQATEGFVLPGRFNKYHPWKVSSVVLGPGGMMYFLAARSGNAYLARTTESGDVEAVCISLAGARETVIEAPQFSVNGDDYQAIWVAQCERDWSLMHAGGRIPEAGWIDLSKMVWRATSGAGLKEPELEEIDAHLCVEAQRIETEGKISDAIERYIYVVVNRAELGIKPPSSLAGLSPEGRLFEMDCAGIREVADQVYRYAVRHPGAQEREMKRLLSRLDIDPAKKPERATPRPAEEDDIREVVCRYMLDHYMHADQKPRAILISFGKSRDVSQSFLDRFADYEIPVKVRSPLAGGGMSLFANYIRWETDSRVKVWGGWSSNPSTGVSYTFTVVKENGVWKVSSKEVGAVI